MPSNGFTADASSQAAAQTMTINGTNFVSGASVLLDGTPLTGVTVVSGTQLTVPVPAGDLQISGTSTVVVANPSPGGGNSNAVVVNINPPTPASPMLMPTSASQLSGGFQLNVNATNVLYDSYIVWNYGTTSAQYLAAHLTTPPTSTGGVGTLSVTINNGLIANTGVVPVAVANPNADGTITTAVSGSANFTVSPPTGTKACLLAGAGAGAPSFHNYAFLATGLDNNGAASMVGSLRIDSTGAVVNTPQPVNSFADFKDARSLFAVNSNGTLGRIQGGAGSCVDTAGVPGVGKVVFTVTGIPGDTFTLNYTLRANGNFGLITLKDSLFGLSATGQIQTQKPTAFNSGSFAFGLLGGNATNSRYAVVGAMCTSSPVFLQADFDDNGTPVTLSASGWSLNPNDATTGRATTTQMNFGSGRILNLVLYGVGGGKAYAMESSPVATSAQVLSGVITGLKGLQCLPTAAGGFSNASLGNAVFGVSSEATAMASVTLGVVNNIAPGGGGTCGAGQGKATLIADENLNGVVHGMIPATQACYSVSAAGRAMLTFKDPLNNNTSTSEIFYLDGAGGGFLLGPGTAIPFGYYGFAAFTFPSGLLPVTSVAITAATVTSGTIADNAVGGSMTVTPYTLDTTTGRGTAMLNNPNTFGDSQVVFYEAGGGQLYIMDQASAAPVMGALIQ
jgi:hypothetical protein